MDTVNAYAPGPPPVAAPGTTTAALVIGGRFNGPAGSGNGGYVAGLLARRLPGPVEVTLRHPTPLDTRLTVTADGRGVALFDGTTILATARPSPGPVPQVVPPPDPADAARAGRASPFRDTAVHPYPGCFVCGPDRTVPDGLRIIPGPVFGTSGVADLWTPDPRFGDVHGRVEPAFLWSALDCPGGLAASLIPGIGRILLGRITAHILGPVRVDESVICHARVTGHIGRKITAETTLHTTGRRLLATATSTWITLEDR